MLSLLIVTAALASPPAPAAGSRLEVGNPSVTGATLRPYTNEWEFTQQRPGGEPVVAGRWTDALEATTFEGHPAWKRTQVAKYTKKDVVIRFEEVFDRQTMASYTFDYSRTNDGNLRHIDFRG